MATPGQEIERWFTERPKWMQEAARRLVLNGQVTEEKDLPELLTICIAEANKEGFGFSGLPSGALEIQDATKPLHLDSISDVHGINALKPKKPLVFGSTQLCIVYGRNGAGKSGYVRLLKHACGTRKPGELIPNIFESSPGTLFAKFTFTEDGHTTTSDWSQKPLPQLCGVDVYDTDCGLVYVDDENEVTFEPWLLRLFSELTRVCESLKQALRDSISLRVSQKPLFPHEYSSTLSAPWYANLKAATKVDDVDSMTKWTAADETELNKLNKRLAEADPAANAVAIRRQAGAVNELIAVLKNLHVGLSTTKCRDFLEAEANAKAKRKVADEDAQKVFEKAPLTGVGSESWRALWEAARAYSTEHAYREVDFPNTGNGSRCVLCQQELASDGRDRYRTFENFVKGELQRLAREAERSVEDLTKALPNIPTPDAFNLRITAAGLADDADKAIVYEFATMLAKRKESLLSASTLSDVAPLPDRSSLIKLVNIGRGLLKQARECEQDAKNEKRPQLEKAQKELSARRWLHQQRKAIDAEISRLEVIKHLQTAEALTSTTALSRKKSMLADELVTNAYIERFSEELKSLGAHHLPVELRKTRADTGRVYHRLFLRDTHRSDVQTSDILSEGEFRIVSLAAFLADTRGRGTKTPFIFDDPISSLDQVYEEATAQRLVNLSKTRQVVVFTHRLSLVGLLEKYSDKEGVEPGLVCLGGHRPGDIANIPITLTRTKQTANRLLQEEIKAARMAFDAGDAEYQKTAKALCRDIRILLEQVVEGDLIGGIIRRYNPEVQTKNKIHRLAKITPEDCKFVDDLITAYSRYEHSQPDEAPVELPKPDEVEKDLKAISAFIEILQKR